MPNFQLSCPHCRATLNFAQPVPAGTPIPCLICSRTFAAPATPAAGAGKPAAAPPKAALVNPAPPAAVAAAVSAKSPDTFAMEPLSSPRRSAPAPRARTAPRDSTPGGPSLIGRVVGGLILAAVALVLLSGLAYLFWLNAPSSDPGQQKGSSPVIAQGPGASKDGSQEQPAPAGKDPPVKNNDPPKQSDPPAKDDDDIANRQAKKPKDDTVKPPPFVEVKEKPETDKPKPAPEVAVEIKAEPIAAGVDAKRINQAIAKGVEYLKGQQQNDGSWPALGSQEHRLGYAAFAGLALLECDVPPNDPQMRRTANLIRDNARNISMTYEVATAILFLDRLGDPNDRDIIRGLGLRLISGQMDIGAWPYGPLEMNSPVLQQIDNHLRTHWPWSAAKPRPANAAAKGAKDGKDGKKVPAAPPTLPPIDLRNLPVGQLQWMSGGNQNAVLGRGDHSNTQFALLGLWAARRHNVPAECPILLSYQHFVAGQNNDGGWGYDRQKPGSTETMTCAGLLGLALGPGLLGAGGKGKYDEAPIERGLALLSGFIGRPSDNPNARPPMPNMYFLWSVERVGVLFDRKTIAGKDWYGWGAQTLLANQFADGHWRGEGYTGSTDVLDTCFALLFLKRSNLVADLTENLKLNRVIRDPGAGQP
jgi:hypothetical protein